MKVQSIRFEKMRNDEHFQFHTEFIELVNRSCASNLKVEALFEAYLQFYRRVDEALKKINKSALTEEIQKADKRRDKAFRGLLKQHSAGLIHFQPEVQQAAKKLSILFNTYGNLARKPLNEQTSAVYNLMQELRGAYAETVNTAGLRAWVDELETANLAFIELYRERQDETAQKPDFILSQERKNLDTAYRQLVQCLSALFIMEGKQLHAEFIRLLNTLVAKHKTLFAQRVGKAKAKRQRAGES